MSTVTVATLNLFHNMGRWDERFPLLLDQLTALRPDVIGLHEVNLGLLEFFQRLLEGVIANCQLFLQISDPNQGPNPREQLARVEGFGHVIIGAELQSLDLHLALGLRSDKHDWNRPGLFAFFDRATQLDPGHLRHHQIGKHQIRLRLVERIERLASIVRHAHTELATHDHLE